MARRPFAFVTKDGTAVRADVMERYAVQGSQQVPKAMAGFAKGLQEPLYNPHSLASLLEINTYHYRACRTKARDTAGKGWYLLRDEVTEEASDTAEQGRKAIEARIADFSRPFNKTLEMASMDFEAVGWGAVELIRERPGDPDTPVIDAVHIPSHTIRITADERSWQQVRGNRRAWFKRAGEKETLDVRSGERSEDVPDRYIANEVVVWHNYTPRSDFYGLPDVIPALGAIVGDVSRRDYNIAFFDNFGVPAYVVMISGDFDPGEPVDSEGNPDDGGKTPLEWAIEEHFEAISKNPHSTLVLSVPSAEDGQGEVEIDIKPLSVETKDASFRMYRMDNRDEILSAHGVDPYRVGIAETGSLSGATADVATDIYKESVVEPRQSEIAHWVNQHVVSDPGWEFRLQELDTTDPDQDLDLLERLFAIGAVTPAQVASHFADRFGLDVEAMDDPALHSYYIAGQAVAIRAAGGGEEEEPEEDEEVVPLEDVEKAMKALRADILKAVAKA